MTTQDAERLVKADQERLKLAGQLGTENAPSLSEYTKAISEVERIIKQIRNDETLKAAYAKLGMVYPRT